MYLFILSLSLSFWIKLLMIWPFSLILAWQSIGYERVVLLHAPTTIRYYNVFHRVTKSWNCWMWKGPLEIIYSHLPAQSRVSYRGLVWAKSSQDFWYVQRWGLHNLCRHCAPVFDHPHSERSLFLCWNGTSCTSVYAQCLLSFQWILLRRVCLCLLYNTGPSQTFVHIDRIPLSHLMSSLNNPSSLSLSYQRLESLHHVL